MVRGGERMYKFRKLMKDKENEEVLEYNCEDTENEECLNIPRRFRKRFPFKFESRTN